MALDPGVERLNALREKRGFIEKYLSSVAGVRGQAIVIRYFFFAL